MICSKCGNDRPKYRKGSRQCKECTYARQTSWSNKPENKVKKKAYYQDNHANLREKQVWSRLQTRYGVTREQYEQMLADQNGVCAICEDRCKTGQRLVVDHNHETGQVRGLLCKSCNFHLGILERKEWVAKAQKYLDR